MLMITLYAEQKKRHRFIEQGNFYICKRNDEEQYVDFPGMQTAVYVCLLFTSR